MKKIVLKCPVCGKQKFQAIPDRIINDRKKCKKEIAGIYVPANTICEHDFVIYVDRNFTVRDELAINDIKRLNMEQIYCLSEIEAIVKKLSVKSIKRILEEI